jgi:hypothetical protein
MSNEIIHLRDEVRNEAEFIAQNPEFNELFELWRANMAALGERIAEGIADFAGLIDIEKVRAYSGTDGAMAIDDDTLILPPESEGE